MDSLREVEADSSRKVAVSSREQLTRADAERSAVDSQWLCPDPDESIDPERDIGVLLAIEVEKLGRFKERQRLEVRDGLAVIVGPSGGGKTAFLKLLLSIFNNSVLDEYMLVVGSHLQYEYMLTEETAKSFRLRTQILWADSMRNEILKEEEAKSLDGDTDGVRRAWREGLRNEGTETLHLSDAERERVWSEAGRIVEEEYPFNAGDVLVYSWVAEEPASMEGLRRHLGDELISQELTHPCWLQRRRIAHAISMEMFTTRLKKTIFIRHTLADGSTRDICPGRFYWPRESFRPVDTEMRFLNMPDWQFNLYHSHVKNGMLLLAQDRGMFQGPSADADTVLVTVQSALETLIELSTSPFEMDQARYDAIAEAMSSIFGYRMKTYVSTESFWQSLPDECVEALKRMAIAKLSSDITTHEQVQYARFLQCLLTAQVEHSFRSKGGREELSSDYHDILHDLWEEGEFAVSAEWIRNIPGTISRNRTSNQISIDSPLQSILLCRDGERPRTLAEVPGSVQQGLLAFITLLSTTEGTVLLDEPTIGFDHAKRILFRQLIARTVQQGRLHCILTTHTPDIVCREQFSSLWYMQPSEDFRLSRVTSVTPEKPTIDDTCHERARADAHKKWQAQSRNTERILDGSYRGIFFVSRVLFVEGRDDERLLAATVALVDVYEKAQSLLRRHDIEPTSLSLGAIFPLYSSSTTFPVRSAAELRIPVGVVLDGDAWPHGTSLQWKALGNDRGIAKAERNRDMEEELRNGGLFLWKGEMEEMIAETIPACRKLFEAVEDNVIATDEAVVEWAVTKKRDKRSPSQGVRSTLHQSWAQIPEEALKECVQELIEGENQQFLALLHFWANLRPRSFPSE